MGKRLGHATALFLAGILVAAPAGAVKDLTPKGLSRAPGSTISLYGATHAIDNKPSHDLSFDRRNRTVSAVPEPAGWLLMLVGFGLLGAMNRRSAPHPLRGELGL